MPISSTYGDALFSIYEANWKPEYLDAAVNWPDFLGNKMKNFIQHHGWLVPDVSQWIVMEREVDFGLDMTDANDPARPAREALTGFVHVMAGTAKALTDFENGAALAIQAGVSAKDIRTIINKPKETPPDKAGCFQCRKGAAESLAAGVTAARLRSMLREICKQHEDKLEQERVLATAR